MTKKQRLYSVVGTIAIVGLLVAASRTPLGSRFVGDLLGEDMSTDSTVQTNETSPENAADTTTDESMDEPAGAFGAKAPGGAKPPKPLKPITVKYCNSVPVKLGPFKEEKIVMGTASQQKDSLKEITEEISTRTNCNNARIMCQNIYCKASVPPPVNPKIDPPDRKDQFYVTFKDLGPIHPTSDIHKYLYSFGGSCSVTLRCEPVNP